MAQVLLTLRPKSPQNTKHEETRIMLGDTSIITQNNGNKQQSTNAQAFTQAFIPQNDNKITLRFVAEKCLFYHLEVERLKAELQKAETLKRLHNTWLLELDRKQQVTK